MTSKFGFSKQELRAAAVPVSNQKIGKLACRERRKANAFAVTYEVRKATQEQYKSNICPAAAGRWERNRTRVRFLICNHQVASSKPAAGTRQQQTFNALRAARVRHFVFGRCNRAALCDTPDGRRTIAAHLPVTSCIASRIFQGTVLAELWRSASGRLLPPEHGTMMLPFPRRAAPVAAILPAVLAAVAGPVQAHELPAPHLIHAYEGWVALAVVVLALAGAGLLIRRALRR